MKIYHQILKYYLRKDNAFKDEEIKLAQSIYFGRKSRVKNGCLYLIIVKDKNPCYLYEKATACKQVLNKNMKLIKEDMRLKIGGSIKVILLYIHHIYRRSIIGIKTIKLGSFYTTSYILIISKNCLII